MDSRPVPPSLIGPITVDSSLVSGQGTGAHDERFCPGIMWQVMRVKDIDRKSREMTGLRKNRGSRTKYRTKDEGGGGTWVSSATCLDRPVARLMTIIESTGRLCTVTNSIWNGVKFHLVWKLSDLGTVFHPGQFRRSYCVWSPTRGSC
ncbi:hypothetical protein J6590_037920, partial [Homalodisca vitripennis]